MQHLFTDLGIKKFICLHV